MKPATSQTGSRWREDRGFALIELLAALFILGLLSAVVLPRWYQASKAADLQGAAVGIATLLRADRNAALRSGSAVLTTVDMEQRLVRSGAAAGNVRWPHSAGARFTHSSRRERSNGGGILFSPDGRSSGGAIILEGPASSYRIAVGSATARVSLSSRSLARREPR